MSEEQFNKFFREKLLKYPSHVPDGMWDRIQGKKGRAFLFLWLIIGMLFIFSVVGYLLLQKNNSGQDKEIRKSYAKKEKGTDNNKDTRLTSLAGQKILLQPATEKNKYSGAKMKTKANTNDTALTSDHEVVSKNIYIKSKQLKHNNTQNLYVTGISQFSTKKARLSQKQKLKVSIANADVQVVAAIEPGSSTINNEKETADESSDSITKLNNIKPTPITKDSFKKNTPQNDTVVQKAKKATRKNSTFLTAYLSPVAPISTFKSGNSFYTVAYLKSIYKIKLSYAAGVSAGITFGKKLSVQTGLQYSQINIAFNTFDSSNLHTKGRYSNFNIPLIIGYNIGRGNLELVVHGGIIYNVSAFNKGSAVYDSAFNTVNVYKSSTGISLYFGLCFNRRVSNHISLFAEPYFIYRPSYITRADVLFKQQIDVTGILFGLKYNF